MTGGRQKANTTLCATTTKHTSIRFAWRGRRDRRAGERVVGIVYGCKDEAARDEEGGNDTVVEVEVEVEDKV
jgi:hypothetical protein